MASKFIKTGCALDPELASDIKLALDPKSRLEVALQLEFSMDLVRSLLNGHRNVTENNHGLVIGLIKAAKLKSSHMAAAGHRIYNEMDLYIDLNINDYKAQNLAKDGKY
jgi:hypothetical protein